MFRFTIREWFLVTTIVALVVVWAVDRRWQQTQRIAAQETAKSAVIKANRLAELEGNIRIYVDKYGPLEEIVEVEQARAMEEYLPFPNANP